MRNCRVNFLDTKNNDDYNEISSMDVKMWLLYNKAVFILFMFIHLNKKTCVQWNIDKKQLNQYLSSPRGAWAFDELRRYHTRPLRLNWGRENVYFGKNHFRDPNIDARVFKTPKIDQIVIPIFWTSHIRTNARDIL